MTNEQMTVFVNKFRDYFSDLWLDIELCFSRKKPEVLEETEKPAPAPLKQEVTSGVLPVVERPPVAKEGAAQILDIRAKKAKEKTERVKNLKLPYGLRHLRLSKKARLYFYDELATLIGSGVPLIDALSVIQAQETDKNLKQLYAQLIHEINGGLSLAEAMEFFPHVFPRMQSALVEAAEASGNLKEVLTELVEDMEASQEFSSKVTGAMIYPVILIFLAIMLVTGMMIFVIPKIAAMYEQANVALPVLTQTVINISNFLVDEWPLILAGVAGTALLFYVFFSRVKVGRLFLESLIGILPVIGKISREKNLMLISANMAMLMKSGVLITEAFSITQNTLSNLHYQRGLERIRQGVMMGKDVSQMMGLIDIRTQNFTEDKLFPLQMAQLIHIGEKTGNIATMLQKIKKNYHKSTEATLRNISTLIEPLMIFFVAAMVGTILMAVMLPFFYIGSTIH